MVSIGLFALVRFALEVNTVTDGWTAEGGFMGAPQTIYGSGLLTESSVRSRWRGKSQETSHTLGLGT